MNRLPLAAALAVALLALALACKAREEAPASPTPEPATVTPAPLPTPTPAVEKPDPQSLLRPGYVLDQTLELPLDGSETGQIVVISHTINQLFYCGGQPPATPHVKFSCDAPGPTAVPLGQDCPSDPMLEVDPSACIYRLEIFSYDPDTGWVSKYVAGNHRGGIQEGMELSTFRLDARREVVVLAAGYCTGVGSGCGDVHEVITVQNGEVKVVAGGWQAGVTLRPDSVTLYNPEYFYNDPFCCPSARQAATVGLDPATGEAAVLKSELLVCTEGVLTLNEYPSDIMYVVCRDEGPVHSTGFLTTDQTVVEPASIGGLQNLKNGDRVRVEYAIEECPEGSGSCVWDILAATRITVLP